MELEDAFKVAFQWCHFVGLGTKTKQGAAILAAKPPQEHMDAVCDQLGEAFAPGKKHKVIEPLKRAFGEQNRGVLERFDFSVFEMGMAMLNGSDS